MALARSLNSTVTAAVARCVFSLKRLDGLCRVIHAWKARLARSQLHSLNVITKDPQNIQGTRPLNFWATQTGQQIYWHWPAALRDSLNRYIPKKKKEFGVDGHFVVPIENIFEKIFSLNLSNRRTRGGHICFLIRILFPVFVFFYLFIYSSTFHSSSFSWMAHGNIKHFGGLFDFFCRWCTRIPLHLLPFSFTLHATLRHPQLHVGQGKRPQKTKTKPTK